MCALLFCAVRRTISCLAIYANSTCSLEIERTIPITEDDAFIVQAKFNASGKVLCVWATGTRADHAYFVRVNEELASATLDGKGSYQKASNAPSTQTFSNKR